MSLFSYVNHQAAIIVPLKYENGKDMQLCNDEDKTRIFLPFVLKKLGSHLILVETVAINV